MRLGLGPNRYAAVSAEYKRGWIVTSSCEDGIADSEARV